MAQGIAVDSKTVTTAGTPEALTTRDIGGCVTVILRGDENNTGVYFIVDDENDALKFPEEGLAATKSIIVPISDPRRIRVDVSVSGEEVNWMAI